MSPSHTNKLGVRYRYYVSHAILQQRRGEVGSIGRVPAADIEKLVLEGVRSHQASEDQADGACAVAECDLIEQRVHSVTIKPRGLEVRLFAMGRASYGTGVLGPDGPQPGNLPTTVLTLWWMLIWFVAGLVGLLVLSQFWTAGRPGHSSLRDELARFLPMGWFLILMIGGAWIETRYGKCYALRDNELGPDLDQVT